MTALLVVLVGYLLGLVPTARLVAGRLGHDPAAEGSGNPGASNVYRTAGRRAGVAVLVGDLLKGAAAASLGWAVGDHLLGVLGGAAAVVGHVLPVTRWGRGGKGVATSGGAVLVLFPLAGLVGGVTWSVLARWTRLASLASLTTVVVVLIVMVATGASAVEIGIVGGLAALVVLRHAGNIVRLARGTERPLEARPS